jgi:hypothetical protein
MTYEQYKNLPQQFKAEYEKKLEALEIVYRASRETEPIASSVRLILQAPDGSSTLASAIKDVLSLLSNPFDINDVIKLVEEHHPEIKKPINPTSVSGGLRQLYKKGMLEVIEPGRGTKPTIYQVIERDNQDDE